MAKSALLVSKDMRAVIGQLLPAGVKRVGGTGRRKNGDILLTIEGDAVPDAARCRMKVALDIVGGEPVRRVEFEAVG